MISRVLGIAAINKDYIGIVDRHVEDVEETVNEDIFKIHIETLGRVYESVGGSVVNTLYAFRQLDNKAMIHIHGIIGTDSDGIWILDKLRSFNLKFIGYLSSEGSTGKTLVISSIYGSRKILICPGVNDLYSRDLVYPLEDYQVQDVLHTSTFACSRGCEPIRAQILAYSLVDAKYRSIMLGSLYCNMYSREEYRPLIDSLIRSVDIVFVREDELNIMFKSFENMLSKFPNIKILIVTMGSRGVKVITDNSVMMFPAPRVDVVDSTGAGDAFAGGFLVGLVRNYDIKRCVELGIICAKHCLTNIGGTGYKICNS